MALGTDEPWRGGKFQESSPKCVIAMIWCFARSAGSRITGCRERYLVSWGCRDNAPNFAKSGRDEARVREMRDAERHVDAPIDQVHGPVEKIEPHRDSLVVVHEGVDHRSQDIFAGDRRRGEGQRPARRRPFAGRKNVGFLEIDQYAAASSGIALTCLAQFERTRRAMKQFSANMRLEESDRAADGCRRSAEAPARTSKTPLGDGRHKDFHRVDAVHFFFRLEQRWLKARQADLLVRWSSRASSATMPRRPAFATANCPEYPAWTRFPILRIFA